MKTDTASALEIRDLTIGYADASQRKVVAAHLNGTLPHGVLTCLIGSNGVGKSTLMRTLAAFQPALDGQVLIGDKPTTAYTTKELSEHIGVVLTDRNDISDLTVEEVVGMGRSPYTNFWGTLSGTDKHIVEEALTQVGMLHLRQRNIQEVSDGERQKTMIAKALAQQTPLIFLDEPTAFLDYPSKIAMMQLLRRLAHQQHKLILLSTHDLEIAFQTADRLWLLQHDGLLTGTLEELSASGAINRFIDSDELTYNTTTHQLIIHSHDL